MWPCDRMPSLKVRSTMESGLSTVESFGIRVTNHEVLKEYHRRGLGGLELGGGLTPRIDGVAEHCSPLFPWPLMAFHGFLGIFSIYKLWIAFARH